MRAVVSVNVCGAQNHKVAVYRDGASPAKCCSCSCRWKGVQQLNIPAKHRRGGGGGAFRLLCVVSLCTTGQTVQLVYVRQARWFALCSPSHCIISPRVQTFLFLILNNLNANAEQNITILQRKGIAQNRFVVLSPE